MDKVHEWDSGHKCCLYPLAVPSGINKHSCPCTPIHEPLIHRHINSFIQIATNKNCQSNLLCPEPLLIAILDLCTSKKLKTKTNLKRLLPSITASYQNSTEKKKKKKKNLHFLTCFTPLRGDQYCSQGNLKGESVVAAILPSRMEISYCTSGFFHS